MKHVRAASALAALLLASASDATQELKLSGQVELMASSGRFAGANQTRDRFTRILGTAEWKNWKLTASYWDYVYCGWVDLDETNLQYSSGNHAIKVGRFIIPLGQANWDEQWYSGFTMLPKVESHWYKGRPISERTSAGIQWDAVIDGRQQIQVAAFGADPNYKRPGWKKLNRGVVRYQLYVDHVIVGLSVLSDGHRGKIEQAKAVDFRWSKDATTIRGTYIDYSAVGSKAKGYYVDVMHRPKGWDTITLVGRLEGFQTNGARVTKFDTFTVGAKVRLPLQLLLAVNYTGGPGMNNSMLGGAWAVSLMRTFRF